MDDRLRSFLEVHHAAIMTTVRKDGSPHVARVGVGLVEGKLWSSGTQDRVRTAHLRRDPRCALAVLQTGGGGWAGLDTEVEILDGPDAGDLNLALYRALAGEPDDVEEYLAAMQREKRLIYQFDIKRAFGAY
jgi:PPOX class probable F420-dependent enzyme